MTNLEFISTEAQRLVGRIPESKRRLDLMKASNTMINFDTLIPQQLDSKARYVPATRVLIFRDHQRHTALE